MTERQISLALFWVTACRGAQPIVLDPAATPASIVVDQVATTTFGWTVHLRLPLPGYLALFYVADGRLRRLGPDRASARLLSAGPQTISVTAASHPAAEGMPGGTVLSSDPTCPYRVPDGSGTGGRCLPGAVRLGHLVEAQGPLLLVAFARPAPPGAVDSLLQAEPGADSDAQLARLRRAFGVQAVGGWPGAHASAP